MVRKIETTSRSAMSNERYAIDVVHTYVLHAISQVTYKAHLHTWMPYSCLFWSGISTNLSSLMSNQNDSLYEY